ncbi:TadE/TadG family type IV pilus assembly protein [Altererythrobacter sp. GH1-8]|uniref:TadE/TadG family type IV pilus assembly protein n=1 Tax=Altererythrobacter sp. GH1-8 TaxID=3349333 RepID=UPI00374D8442
MKQRKVRSFKAKRFWQNQDGAVAATYALALIPIIALAGLAFDYTRLAGMDTELQNAADQAALAGATQLDRRPGAIERAIAAIQGGLVDNSTLFANDSADQTVNITDTTQIVFYNTRADAEAGTNPILASETGRFAEAGFVQVTVDTRAANYALTPIVGAVRGSINAEAVAGLGSAVCRVPPLMVCNPEEPGTPAGATPFDADAYEGQGLLAKPGGGGKWTPGNYGYLDIGPNGATGVRQALGWDGPPGECISQSGVDTIDVDTQTGNIASGPRAINTRFDVYDSNGCVSGGSCSPARNVRKDLMRKLTATPATGNACDIHNSGWEEPANAYHPTAVAPYTGTIDSMGHPRNICHAVEDGTTGECKDDPFGGGTNWDRAAYFRTHYGASFDWAGTTGLGANVTRYKTYLYELDNIATALADTTAGNGGNTRTTRNQPVCGQQYGWNPGTTSQDRRVMTVAVINCNLHNVSGNSTNVPVQTWMDVFLVQPSYARGSGGKFTKQDEIYVEIIGEANINNTGTVGGPLIRRDQPYLVK